MRLRVNDDKPLQLRVAQPRQSTQPLRVVGSRLSNQQQENRKLLKQAYRTGQIDKRQFLDHWKNNTTSINTVKPNARNFVQQTIAPAVGSTIKFGANLPNNVSSFVGTFLQNPVGATVNTIGKAVEYTNPISYTIKALNASPAQVGNPYEAGTRGATRAANYVGEKITPDAIERPMIRIGRSIERVAARQADRNNQAIENSVFATQARPGENSAVVNLSSGVGSLASSVALGPARAPIAFGLNAGGDQIRQARAAGLSPEQAFSTGLQAGAVEAGLEKVGLDKFLANIAGNRVLANSFKNFLTEGSQELAQSLAQSGITSQYQNVDWAQAIQEALVEGLYGGLIGGGSTAISISTDNLIKQGVPQQVAERFTQSVKKFVADQGGFIAGPQASGFKQAQEVGRVFEGVDGKPRFEVDDSGAKLRNLKDADRQMGSGETLYLEDVLDHKMLYEQYPQVALTPIRYDNTLKATAAWNGAAIVVNPNLAKTDNQLKSAIIHEVQHNIQDIESFAGGGDPNSSIELGVSDINRQRVERGLNPLATSEVYKNLAGEAEARAVANRMNMSDGERYRVGDKYQETSTKPLSRGEMFDGTPVTSVAANQELSEWTFRNRPLENRSNVNIDWINKEIHIDLNSIERTNKGDYYEKVDEVISEAVNEVLAQEQLGTKPYVAELTSVPYEEVLSTIKKTIGKTDLPIELDRARLFGSRATGRSSRTGYRTRPTSDIDIAVPQKGLKVDDLPNNQKIDMPMYNTVINGVDTDILIVPEDYDIGIELKRAWEIKDVAKLQSTFYDSLDVPKEDLIIRDGSGKAMSVDNIYSAPARTQEKARRALTDYVDYRRGLYKPKSNTEINQLISEARQAAELFGIDITSGSADAIGQRVETALDRFKSGKKINPGLIERIGNRISLNQTGSISLGNNNGDLDSEGNKTNAKNNEIDPQSDSNIQAYADFLQSAEPTDGVTIMPDGSRSSSHSPFYREFYKENKKAPTKADWYDEAQRQIESGEAPREFTNQTVDKSDNKTIKLKTDQQTPQVASPRAQSSLESLYEQGQQLPPNLKQEQIQSQPYQDNTLNGLSSQEAEQLLEAEIEKYSQDFEAFADRPNSRKARQLVDSIAEDNKITKARAKAQTEGSEFNFFAAKDSNGRSVGIQEFNPGTHRIEAGFVVDSKGNVLGNHVLVDETGISVNVGGELVNMSQLLGDISDWGNQYRVTDTMEANLRRNAPNEGVFKRTYNFLIAHKLKAERNFRTELAQQRADLAQRAKNVQSVRPSGVSKSDYNAAIFDYIEGNDVDIASFGPEAQQAIETYKDATRKLYDDLLDRVNTEFARFGEKTIEKRQDYITHINELMGRPSFAGEMFGRLQNTILGEGQQRTRGDVPSDIAGRTENFEPRKRWNPFAQRRMGGEYSKDPFKAVDAYLEPTLYNIHMTEAAVRARAIESAMRAAQAAQELKQNPQGLTDAFIETLNANKDKKGNAKLVTGMAEFANALAGKTQRWDRQVVDSSKAGETALRAWQTLQRIGGRSTILGNLQSTFSQTLGLPSMIADAGPINMVKGIARYTARDKVIEKSNFVQSRLTNVDSPFDSNFEKTMQVAGKPLQYVENQMVKMAWYAEYENALASGLTGQEAIIEADRNTERIVAGRGIADRPEAYRSTLANGFLQYTLEVNAQNKAFWRDFTPAQKGEYIVGTFVMNAMMGMLTGFEPLPDPIEATIATFGDFMDEDDERSGIEKAAGGVQRLAGEAVDMNPILSSLITNTTPDDFQRKVFGEDSDLGRFRGQAAPINLITDKGYGVVDNAIKLATAEDEAQRDAAIRGMRDDALAFVPAGNQIKKTTQGVELLNRGYNTDGAGNPTYPAPRDPFNRTKAILFGPSATTQAGDYYDNNRKPITGDNAERIRELNDSEAGAYIKLLNERRQESKDERSARDDRRAELEGSGIRISSKDSLDSRADQLREDAGLMDMSLDDVIDQYNLPSDVNSYEKAAAHISGKYEDYLKAYNLEPDEPKQASGDFAGLIERNTESDMIKKAKALYNGYEDVPEWVKNKFYEEAGVTPDQIEYDIASGFRSDDKAQYLAQQLGNLSYEERMKTLIAYRQKSLSGNYMANPKTLDLLADMGIITEDDADALSDYNYVDGKLEPRKSGGKRKSSGGGKKKSLLSLAPKKSVTTANDIRLAFSSVTPKSTTTPNVDTSRIIRIGRG